MSTLPPNACRLRVKYMKDGRLAHLGHLEVMETIMRSVRRSGIPFEVGNGFARRMRIQFSQALPVGASSKGEYYDLLLVEPFDEVEALSSLEAATPHLLAPRACKLLPRRVMALEAWANMSEWEVCVREPALDARTFDQKLAEVMDEGVIHFMRGDKKRSISVTDTLMSCEAADVEGGVDLRLLTRSSNAGALRPAILVNAVCGVLPLRVCRTSQWHEDEGEPPVDPMDQTR